MALQQRQLTGTPKGGQFAPNPHPEGPELKLVRPSLWKDLDSVLAERIGELAQSMEGGVTDTTVLDLLDMDEDGAITAYGAERGTWLASLDVILTASTRQTSAAQYEGPLAGPSEDEVSGSVTVCSGSHILWSGTFSDDTPPAVPKLTSFAPFD